MAVGEWRLQYDGVDLSLDDDAHYLSEHPEVGAAEMALDDVEQPRGDGRRFGEDFLGGTTVVLPITLSSDVDAAGDVLRRAWRADRVRRVPGAVAELRSPRGRAAIGRPRRYLADDSSAMFGKVRVTATFDTVDDLWYGDPETVTVPFVPPTSGGLIPPLIPPLVLSGSSAGTQVADIGGDVETPHLLLGISGPIVNPRLEAGPLVLELSGVLAHDESVVIDARSWVRTVLKGAGSAAGMVTRRSTPMPQMRLAPGRHQVVLRGSSPSGTASGWVTHRPAYASY